MDDTIPSVYNYIAVTGYLICSSVTLNLKKNQHNRTLMINMRYAMKAFKVILLIH